MRKFALTVAWAACAAVFAGAFALIYYVHIAFIFIIVSITQNGNSDFHLGVGIAKVCRLQEVLNALVGVLLYNITIQKQLCEVIGCI